MGILLTKIIIFDHDIYFFTLHLHYVSHFLYYIFLHFQEVYIDPVLLFKPERNKYCLPNFKTMLRTRLYYECKVNGYEIVFKWLT